MNELTTLQRSLITIKKLKQQLRDQNNMLHDPIAIIGLSCRFPGANNKEAFWELLKQGKNVISPMPEERWELLKNTKEILLRDKNLNYNGGYFKNISDFDAYFFGISPREAIRMDPQQRLLLEVAYESIEDAGIPIEKLAGSKTGVFTSLYTSHYGHLQILEDEKDALYFPTGNALSIAANRLSYLLDLHGPSLVIDTACSSSLVGLHLACLNLQAKLCDQALVCGVNINLLPSIHALLFKAKMLSPNGQCKTFDASADGYVQGEGAASIVLKPLSKALENKDRIYAVICGSGINQDGKTNGLTAPNGLQQEVLLRSVYSQYQINPDEVSYVETHGTGTYLGDPIELEALGKVIGETRGPDKPCWVGSVKTNIGHLEPAAGLASIIKVVLSMQNKQIAPHLNVTQPNPLIDFNRYHLQIPKQLQEWPCYGNHRIAGISGFGFGGTNAHVILRDIDSNESHTSPIPSIPKQEMFILSAKDDNALKQLIKDWITFLENNKSISINQICFNLRKRKSHYAHQFRVIISNFEELIKLLKEEVNKSSHQENLSINWDEHQSEVSYQHCDMPLYPWQHKRYWPDLSQTLSNNIVKMDYPLQGKYLSSPLLSKQFEFQFDTKTIPEIKDTFNILHAGYYLEMLAFSVNQLSLRQNDFTITDLEFNSPLIVPDDKRVNAQLVLENTGSNNYSFKFYSLSGESRNWINHAKGGLIISQDNPEFYKDKVVDSFTSIQKRCFATGDKSIFYNKIVSMGMPAGESIRWTKNYFLGNNEILCELQSPQISISHDQFALRVHFGIIDGCIQSLFMMLSHDIMKPYVASHIGQIRFHYYPYKQLYLYAVLDEVSRNGEKIKGSWYLLNEKHQILANCKDIKLTQYNNKIHIQDVMQTKKSYKFDCSLSSEDQLKKISTFLLKEAAEIFSMPESDMDINQSLTNFGMDSLMALTFIRIIETSFEVTYSLNDIMKAESIIGIAKAILAMKQLSEQPVALKSSHPWIAHRVKRPLATRRIFCFPYGGAGASIYRDWYKEFPESIEVCPIQLPGREERMNELPIQQMDVLINRLYENIQSELDIPFSFFGHSFGSLIAFELTRFLRRNQFTLPFHLFVSAYPDPELPSKSLNNLLSQLKSLNINLFDLNESSLDQITDEKLLSLSTIFTENGIIGYNADKSNNLKMEKDIVKILLPIFIGDMSLVKNYVYSEEAPLNLPITVFLGTQDQWVPLNDHLSWRKHTMQECTIKQFDSGHLFIKDKCIRSKIAQVITESLLSATTLIT